MKNGERRIYRISEITRLIKDALESAFGEVCVEGEISNFRRPTSGHFYFTLKDDSAQLSAVMFRGNQAGLKFQPKDGLLVRVTGQQLPDYRQEHGGSRKGFAPGRLRGAQEEAAG
jgi:exodeoxyribonuclease VII large subunit